MQRWGPAGAAAPSRRLEPEYRRKRDSLREFHEFSKKMKLDAGLTIRTLAGGDVVELDELFADSEPEPEPEPEVDSDSSDGVSETEFVVDPEAALRPDQGDESYIDPETGDFVDPKRRSPERRPDVEEPTPDDEDDDKSKAGNVLNVRRNIREVMDENQLDASTLAAQRLESERLARVQEQQRIIREVRRQIALSRQDKAQARVLSLLQGRTGSSLLKKPALGSMSITSQSLNLPGTVLTKLPSTDIRNSAKILSGNLTPSVSIAPVAGPIKQDIGKAFPTTKKDVVEIVDSSSSESSSESGPSSDSDDCIMLSDSELPPSPEADEDPQNSGLHVNDAYNIPDDQGRVVINIGHPENEEDIFLAPQISRIIKPHQIGGVRFLFDNIIESVDRFSTSTGFGCILAHSMGLGKTLQIVCFCDIFLRHTNSKTVLCIMPINTLQNWVAEFNLWLPSESSSSSSSSQGEVRPRNFSIYVLNDSHKTLRARAKVIKDWTETGGVLMIGYELYRLLSLKKNKKPRNRKKKADSAAAKTSDIKDKMFDKKDFSDFEKCTDSTQSSVNEKSEGSFVNSTDAFHYKQNILDNNEDKNNIKDVFNEIKDDTDEEKLLLDEIYTALVKPGPDLVICDEGHRIKNSHSNISYALKQMRTKRRIVLTGYPLQNNLLEYWCMVDFVRPNYLGTKTEFSNMFERPIQNGQCIDSTPQDIRLMRYRAHVLHSLLVGFVQRRSHAVLQTTLPQKEEYVLLVRMTELQKKLYDIFMNEVVRKKSVPNPLKAFAVCCKIWNHPDVLYYFLKKRNESAAVVDYDLEIEENPSLNANSQTNNQSGPKEKKGRKNNKKDVVKKEKKEKKEKKQRTTVQKDKKGKPAATIQPNTSNKNPVANNYESGKQDSCNGSQNYNSNAFLTNSTENKNVFVPPAGNQNSNYPPYQDYNPQYPSTYYSQNDSYGSSFNSSYYPNTFNNEYNNYNVQNPQVPPGNQTTQQNMQRYPENTDFNSQNYWGNNSNYYNSNPGYYPNQTQHNFQTNQGSYDSIYDPYNQPNQNYNFNSNRSYDGNVSNGEHSQSNYNPLPESTDNVYQSSDTSQSTPRVYDEGQSTANADVNTYSDNNTVYTNYQGLPNSQENKSLHDEISALCWPVSLNDDSKHETPDSKLLINKFDIKNEAKAVDSDNEIKIADLDTMKVINDKPLEISQPKEKLDVNVKLEESKSFDKVESVDPSSEKIKNEDSFVKNEKDTLDKKGSGMDTKIETKTEKKDVATLKEKKSKVSGELKSKKTKDSEEFSDNESENDIEKKEKEDCDRKAERYEEVSYDWATDLIKNYIPGIIENSAKMEIFFCILEESIRLGDRLLLFSQSLFTLNLIEDFLQKNIIPGTEQNWAKNKSYYRLDGSTSALEREKLINEFNSNPNIHLFLVSTRAGSLGINLVGANRVLVFDASWNPCHDTQAVCRVYRYGQQKPCFVYRLVMDRCLEKKIYDRQINKQGMSDRVVDECNPDAVLSMKEVTNLCWDNDEKEDNSKEFQSDCKTKFRDIIMENIIENHGKTLSKEPFQHESLLVDRKEKKLSSAEKRLAQRGYELEKKAAANPKPSMMYRTIRTADGTLIQRPVASVRPMQHGSANAASTRWIPADVWQRQGMTAQEMTLPLDVVIPTNSAEKNSIVLKAGQKVMVLKSPKGIYMQLESGKIIAIKTSFKVGQGKIPDAKEPLKKVLPSRPPNISLPGSLKNNSAITVISKSARGGMQKIITRPPIIQKKMGTPIRPMMAGPRILDSKIRGLSSNLQVKPLSIIRGRSPMTKAPKLIPIQNSLSIRIQGSHGQNAGNDFKEDTADLEKNPMIHETDSNSEFANNDLINNDKIISDSTKDGSNEHEDSIKSNDSTLCDEVVKYPQFSATDDIPEDTTQDKIYTELSDKNDSKFITKPINKKMNLLNKSAISNVFKDCNIQIRNPALKSSPIIDLPFMNNVTIKRTSVSTNVSNNNPISKNQGSSSMHVHSEESCSSEGALSDHKPSLAGNPITLEDDSAEEDSGTREKKIYKPNLIDRKTKMNSLKNYRHQKHSQKPIFIQSGEYPIEKLSPVSTSSTPTPPPVSGYSSVSINSNKVPQDKYQSSLSQLEKTAISISKNPRKSGLSDFQQSLSDITQSYPLGTESNQLESGLYKPGPKSRKKKTTPTFQNESQTNQSADVINSNNTEKFTTGVNIISPPNVSNDMSSSQTGSFAQTPYNTEAGNHPPSFSSGFHTPSDPAVMSQQPYNSYPGYPSGTAYPPYAPPYYQPYPPTAPYPPYPQYHAPPYPPAPYPPSPYPGYPPYPNTNPHQW